MNYNHKEFQTFNDGVVEIYRLKDVSEPGMRPDLRPALFKKFHFRYRTVGVKRAYEAMQSHVRLDELISLPCDRGISTQDLAKIGDIVYEIKQIQHKTDTKPPTTWLSLTRTESSYDFTGI